MQPSIGGSRRASNRKRAPLPSKHCLQDLNHRTRRILMQMHQTLHNAAGYLVEAFRAGIILTESRHRLARIPTDTDSRVDFYLPQERNAKRLGHPLALPVAKHVNLALAMWAGEVA